MDPIAHIDRVDTLSTREINGVVRQLIRKARVVNLERTDYTVLYSALEEAGIPRAGDSLPDDPKDRNIPGRFDQLVCVERDAQVILEDPSTVDVTLTYQHFMEGVNQNLTPGGISKGVIYGKMRTSTQQLPLNFYTDPTRQTAQLLVLFSTGAGYNIGDLLFLNGGTLIDGQAANRTAIRVTGVGLGGIIQQFGWVVVNPGLYFIDPLLSSPPINPVGTTGGPLVTGTGAEFNVTWTNKIQLTVQHTFYGTDGGQNGRTDIQGGEVHVAFPQRNFSVVGYIDTEFPWAIEAQLIRRVNLVTWQGGGPTEWMCTEVQWEPMEPSPGAGIFPGRYKFTFEFQHNPDGWQPTIVYIDQKTGRPPAGLIPGVGYKTIPYYIAIDFDFVFQAFFEG